MHHPYGVIIGNRERHVTRLRVLPGDRVVLQTLRLEEQVEVTLAELGAITGLVEQSAGMDPLLEKWLGEQRATRRLGQAD
jgi:hypothetical protein